MNKISFLFLSVFLLFISIYANVDSLPLSFQLIGSVTLIALLGIPHGAIDHIIFFEDNKGVSAFQFYAIYFGLMGIYLIGWFIIPSISLLFFLLMSAYHFGQSQFSDLANKKFFLNSLVYFFWGCSILSGLILYNIEEILSFTAKANDLTHFAYVFNKEFFSIALPISSLVTVLLLIVLLFKKRIRFERFFFEIYILLIIHVCFFLLPLLIGFTLYFVILHSLKVMTEEFAYLKIKRKKFSIRSFVQLLMPLTLVSIVGGGIILLCAHYDLLGISSVLLVFILISILTLPHSIVMEYFYQKFMQKQS